MREVGPETHVAVVDNSDIADYEQGVSLNNVVGSRRRGVDRRLWHFDRCFTDSRSVNVGSEGNKEGLVDRGRGVGGA